MMMQGMAALFDGIARIEVPWMLGGSVGAMCYSEPRATLDVDCVIDLRTGHEQRIIDAFPESDFYVPPLNVIAHEIRRGALGSFNIIHHETGFKADCYPCGNDDLMRWGLTKATLHPIADLNVPVAPPEYIVCMKLRYFAMSGQDKHLRDIRSIIRLLPTLDTRLIAEWATHYGVADAWQLSNAGSDRT